jgi:ABC-2 type transport system ATP-binding protein
MLQVDALKKSYGALVAVDGVSLRAGAGEIIGLLGPNGAGKTTTVSMIAGLVRPDSGTVEIEGRRLSGDTDPNKRRIGLVPQDLALFDELTAQANLQLFAALYDLDGAAARRAIGEALELVGLADRAQDRVKNYSGGMKRRLNLAAALLHDPQILLLDEPTVGVDPQSRNSILETVGRLGIAVLYTTHYMEEAARLCDRIGIIDDGRLVAEGTAEMLIATHGGKDKVHLSCDGESFDELSAACLELDNVHDVHEHEGNLELTTDHGPAVLSAVVAVASRHGVDLTGVEVRAPNLEDVFLTLTGKELRD